MPCMHAKQMLICSDGILHTYNINELLCYLNVNLLLPKATASAMFSTEASKVAFTI